MRRLASEEPPSFWETFARLFLKERIYVFRWGIKAIIAVQSADGPQGGVGATYSSMLAGQGIARSSLFTVPAKLSIDVLSLFVSINRVDTSARAATFSYCIQNQAGRLLKGIELSCTSDVPYRHEAGTVPLNVQGEKTDIWFRCEAVSVSNTNVTAAIFGYTRNSVNFGL